MTTPSAPDTHGRPPKDNEGPLPSSVTPSGGGLGDTEPSGPKVRKAAMLFIAVAVLIDMIAIGVILPVLPHIVGNFTPSKDAQTFWFGVMTFAFGAANFFGSPILGALSDQYGRRPVLLIGFSGLALGFFVTAAATALWMIVVVRLFSGAMQANIAVANAYVADITAPEDRARRFGQLGAMFGIGFILGPALGGWLGAIDLRFPFIVAGVLALINTVYGVFVLPESLALDKRRAFDWRRANPLAALRGLSQLQGVGPLVATIALSGLAQFTLYTTWVLYTHFKFGWGPAEVGFSLFVVGLMAALVQGVLLRHLLARFSPRKLAAFGLAAGAFTYLGYALAPTGEVIYAVIVVGALLGGAAPAAMQSIVSNSAGSREQGQTMGAVASLNSLMAVVAPILGTALLGFVSHRPQGDVWIGLPFFFCAAVQAAAALLAIRFFRRQPTLAVAPT
jgi:MFS transporter, DHA1 family, tetracycline resistance protein